MRQYAVRSLFDFQAAAQVEAPSELLPPNHGRPPPRAGRAEPRQDRVVWFSGTTITVLARMTPLGLVEQYIRGTADKAVASHDALPRREARTRY